MKQLTLPKDNIIKEWSVSYVGIAKDCEEENKSSPKLCICVSVSISGRVQIMLSFCLFL